MNMRYQIQREIEDAIAWVKAHPTICIMVAIGVVAFIAGTAL